MDERDDRACDRMRGGRRGLALGGLGAVGLVVMTLALADLLLPACGLRAAWPESWLDACPSVGPPPPTTLEAAAARRAALEDRVAGLERRVAGLPACPPQAAPEPDRRAEAASAPAARPDAPVRPRPEPESEFDARMREQGGREGDGFTVTLVWDDRSDLDLHVVCPGGGRAGAGAAGCAGGVLDVDANGYLSGGLRMLERPVENLRFPASAPAGRYEIEVLITSSYARRTGFDGRRNRGPHPFRVRVKSGEREQVFRGVVRRIGAPVRFAFER